MNNSESAEALVRMSIDGVKVAAQLSGTGIKNIAVILYSIINDQKKISGKTALKKMIKNHPNLKIFSLSNQDLKKFTDEAKRYGVLFAALVDKMDPNGSKEIFIRAEDAPKVNRIIEKFNLAAVDTAEINSIISKDKDPKVKDTIHSELDDLVEEILSKPKQKEEHEQTNPSMGQTKEKSLSENSSKKQKSKVEISKERPSVRKAIKEIKEELKQKREETPKEKGVMQEVKHKQPENKKRFKRKGSR